MSRQKASGAIIRRNALWWVALPMLTFACDGCNFGLQTTPPPAGALASEIAFAGGKVMIGAGDIGDCGNLGDEGTARLVDSVLKTNAAANVETVVFALGDYAYPMATDRQLRRCLTPSWGDSKKGIMKVIRPAIGNHDYQVSRGAPYYKYFGDRAGEKDKGYYSYDLGDWHVIVLNSELAAEGTSSAIAEQANWLRQDLAANSKLCTLAYFHRPLFSSAYRQGNPEIRSIWNLLYESNVDLVLNGHDHHYERSRPQTPAGVPDSVRGIPQIIVGTGGATLRGFKSRFGFAAPPLAQNSLVQIQGRFGVVKLTLGSSEWRSAFLEVNGRIWDPAGGKCR